MCVSAQAVRRSGQGWGRAPFSPERHTRPGTALTAPIPQTFGVNGLLLGAGDSDLRLAPDVMRGLRDRLEQAAAADQSDS